MMGKPWHRGVLDVAPTPAGIQDNSPATHSFSGNPGWPTVPGLHSWAGSMWSGWQLTCPGWTQGSGRTLPDDHGHCPPLYDPSVYLRTGGLGVQRDGASYKAPVLFCVRAARVTSGLFRGGNRLGGSEHGNLRLTPVSRLREDWLEVSSPVARPDSQGSLHYVFQIL